MNPLIGLKPYVTGLKLAAFFAAVLAAYLYGRSDGKDAGSRGVNAMRQAQTEQAVREARAGQQAAEDQAQRYRLRAESNEAIAADYLEKLNHANRTGDKVAADLRAGTVRFNRLWAQCQAVPAPRDPAAYPGPAADPAADRAESAGRILAAAAACDAQYAALLKIAQCDRNPNPEKCRD